MKYFTFSKTDLTVSSVTLGTWVFGGTNWGKIDERQAIDAVHAAFEQGITTIDTAPIYGGGQAESIVGKAIKGHRSDYVIATKCGLHKKETHIINDLSPESIRQEIEASLTRLGTDYIDLYQCHWPDENISAAETFECLKGLQREGKIRYFGISNYSGDTLKEAASLASVVTLQSQYSLLDRAVEKFDLPFCCENDIGFLAYGPLSGGILSGKYKHPKSFKSSDARKFFYQHYEGQRFKRVKALLDDLQTLEKPLAAIAINWVRQQKGVASVLVGCRNRDQAGANAIAVAQDFSDKEMAFISEVLSKQSF